MYLHLSDSGFNANLSVYTVLIVKVYVVSLKTFQRGFASFSDVLWGPIHISTFAISMRHQPKLSCQGVPIPLPLQCFA